jgi:chromosome condensin MukBEF MukE localization factor
MSTPQVQRALVDRLSRLGSVTVVGDSAQAFEAIEAIHQDGIDIGEAAPFSSNINPLPRMGRRPRTKSIGGGDRG